MATQAPVWSGDATAADSGSLGTQADLLLADVLRGNGGFVVVGGSGVGAVPAHGRVRVIHTAASESEAELPYAALVDVVRPLLHLLDAIPTPQGDALRAAFALAPPQGADRLAICAGTLSLLAASAPVLVVVDEAQWIDASSAEPLLFAFRRLDGLRAGALLHVRSGSATPFVPRQTPTVADDPARELIGAADSARAAGHAEKALRLLDEALGCSNDPLIRADVQHMRGLVTVWRTAPAHAARQLSTEAHRIEQVDPARAARMTADAAWAWFVGGDLDAGLTAAEQAGELAREAGGTAEVLATGVLGIARLLRGHASDTSSLAARCSSLVDELDAFERDPTAIWPTALALVWLEEYAQARTALTALIDFARTNGRPAMLAHALVCLSELEFRIGDWVAARAAATEAAHLADEAGQPVARALSLLGLARVDAPQGREEECTAHVFEAVRLAPAGAGALLVVAGTRLGALELALGRSDATISHLEQVAQRAVEQGLRDPSVVQSAPDLIEAYVRCGRRDDAEAAVHELEQQARATGRVWARAAAARGRGLLAPPAAFDAAFQEARVCEAPFERGRTDLCYGERLRRARRRTDARAPLRGALETFERLGAEPWAARARAELRATGETVRRGAVAGADELTPQELEIARLVAAGATNREAAAALYLSAKTIETHLGRVYRKLGVRSRTELARRLV